MGLSGGRTARLRPLTAVRDGERDLIMPASTKQKYAPRATISRGLLRRLNWALARLREGRKLTAADLARTFEMSVRNAYRDLDVLRDDWRVPVQFDRAQGTFTLTEPAALVAPISRAAMTMIATCNARHPTS